MPAVDLIRHGQSTFNAAYTATGIDPLHFDARLTALGRKQADEVRLRLLEKRYDVIVTTPLIRALETTLAIFGGRDIPIVVEALHRERLESSCDVGSRPIMLADEFPQFAFNHLAETWWHDAEERDERGFAIESHDTVSERVSGFARWLAERGEQSIAVVGHGTFFYHLTGHRMTNCEVLSWDPATFTPLALEPLTA